MKSTSPSDVLRPVRPGLLAAALAVAALLPACTRSGAGAAGELVLSGNLEVDDAQLGFKTAGRVVARPVSEGDRVRAGQLIAAAIDDEPPVPIRRVNDLETLLDRLALVEPRKEAGPGTAVAATEPTKAKRNVLTFAPDGARGVAAYVDGEKTATA